MNISYAWIIQGILLGLSTGVACLTYCFPVYLTFFLSEERPRLSANAKVLGNIMLGRFIAYILAGAIMGLLGEYSLPCLSGESTFPILNCRICLIEPLLLAKITGGLYILLGVLMIIYGITFLLGRWNLCLALWSEIPKINTPFYAGFLTGINICPPFIPLVIDAFRTGAVSGGLLYFTAFFLGTTLYFLPLIFIGRLSRIRKLVLIARCAAILAGGYYLYSGIKMLL